MRKARKKAARKHAECPTHGHGAGREAGDGMIRRAVPLDYLIASLVLAAWYAVLVT